jgi:hypothetical protein
MPIGFGTKTDLAPMHPIWTHRSESECWSCGQDGQQGRSGATGVKAMAAQDRDPDKSVNSSKGANRRFIHSAISFDALAIAIGDAV